MTIYCCSRLRRLHSRHGWCAKGVLQRQRRRGFSLQHGAAPSERRCARMQMWRALRCKQD